MTTTKIPANFTFIQPLKINNQITAPELLTIDEAGKSLGIMPRDAALQLAKERRLDLIEVTSQVNPPVARIMSFDKFRYQQEKKLKKQKVSYKQTAVKQVQIGSRTALHDLQLKANQANKFLTGHHPLNVVLVLRGREKGNRDWARQRLEAFLKMLAPHKIVSPPKFFNRGLQIQIVAANR